MSLPSNEAPHAPHLVHGGERLVFGLLFALALLANAAVICRSRYWPGGDLGGHMELLDVVMRYDDPHTAYRTIYELPGSPGPNGLVLYVGRALRGISDTVGVTRGSLVFYVTALPLAILALCRAYGRSPWLAFLAVPLVFSSFYNHGFLNFLVAMPLLVLSIAVARTFAERGGTARGVALAALLALLLIAHVVAFLIGVSIVAFLLVLHAPSLRDARRLAVLVPAFGPLAPWVMRMFAPADATHRSFVSGGGDLGLIWTPREELLANIHHFGLRIVRDDADEYLVLALALLLGATLGFHPHGEPSLGPSRPGVLASLRAHSLELVTLVCVAMFFVLPSHMNEMAILTERVIFVILLLAVVWPRMRFDTVGTRVLLVPIVALGFVYAAAMDVRHRAFDARYFTTLPRAIAALRDGSRMAYVWLDAPENEIFHVGPLVNHPRAIHAIANGGITDDSFAMRHYTPVQYRPGMRPPVVPHGRFWESAALDAYDAVLVHALRPPAAALVSPRLALRYHDGVFWLFDVVRPSGSLR